MGDDSFWLGGLAVLSKGGQHDAGIPFSFGAVTKGIFLSLGVTLFVAVVLGIAVSLTQWEGISGGAHWFSYVSIALGGMLAAKHSRRFGWIHGAVVGLAYFTLSAIAFQPGFEWAIVLTGPWLMKAFWSAAAGAVGGVLGVNI